MGRIKKDKPILERMCKYCELAASLKDPDEMLCQKRGVVNAGYCCRLFRYDPLKRDPGALPKITPLLLSEDEESPTEI